MVSFSLLIFSLNSVVVNPFISAFFISLCFSNCLFYIISANRKSSPDRQFSIRQCQSFLCCRHSYTSRFEKNRSRLYYCYPVFRGSFTFTHAHFGRFAS